MDPLPDELIIELLVALGDSRSIVNLAASCRDYGRVARDDRVERQLKRRWRRWRWIRSDHRNAVAQRLPGAMDGFMLRWIWRDLWSRRYYICGLRNGIQIEWDNDSELEWLAF